MSRLDAVSYISHGVGKGGRQIESRTPQGASETSASEGEAAKDGKQKEAALGQYTVTLHAKATAGKVDPLTGRGPEVDRTHPARSSRSRTNPPYVRDPGAGKPAIPQGTARKIVEGNAPATHRKSAQK